MRRPSSIRVRQLAGLCAALAILAGCSDPAATLRPSSTLPAPPLQLREDASTYGQVERADILGAAVTGRTLVVQVAYGGGCHTHDVEAIGATKFEGSETQKLNVYIRHDGDGDRCLAYIFKTLSYDLTPVLDLYVTNYGRLRPFYLVLTTPNQTYTVRVPYGFAG